MMGVRTDTRDRMVTSAAMLLRERGVAGTTIAKVLEHSNGPRGSVAFHFPGGRDELLSDAVRWAGRNVSTALRAAAENDTAPIDVVTMICQHYREQLEASDFSVGCPIGAAAHESHQDPELGPVVAAVVEEWIGALSAVLVGAGHEPRQANELAVLCISSFEGAITIARVLKSSAPLDGVVDRVVPLLEVGR